MAVNNPKQVTTVQIDVKTRDLLKELALMETRSLAAEIRWLARNRALELGLLVRVQEAVELVEAVERAQG
jgi:hypothetical protein